LCAFKLLPHGFANRDLRPLIAQFLGKTPEAITSGQMSYDLRRLRTHGLIKRIPHIHRYQVTSTGLRQAMFLTRLHDRLGLHRFQRHPGFLQPGQAGVPQLVAGRVVQAADRTTSTPLADDGPEEFPTRRVLLVSGRLLTWYGPSLATDRADLLSAIGRP